MKRTILSSLLALAAFTSFAAAETTITLQGVHNCCKGCANGITKAAEGIKDVTVTPEGKKVTITAKSKTNAKKAVEAIQAAGYFGTSEDEVVQAKAPVATSAKPEKKLTSATVTGAHLCCGKCVTAVSDAVKTVAGITKSNIVAKSKTFTVEGEFSEKELLAALNKAGFSGAVSN